MDATSVDLAPKSCGIAGSSQHAQLLHSLDSRQISHSLSSGLASFSLVHLQDGGPEAVPERHSASVLLPAPHEGMPGRAGIHPRRTEHQSRSTVQNEGSQRLALEPRGLLGDLAPGGALRRGHVRIMPQSTTPSLLVLDEGTGGIGRGCVAAAMARCQWVREPPLGTHPEDIAESQSRTGINSAGVPSVAISSLVPGAPVSDIGPNAAAPGPEGLIPPGLQGPSIAHFQSSLEGDRCADIRRQLDDSDMPSSRSRELLPILRASPLSSTMHLGNALYSISTSIRA